MEATHSQGHRQVRDRQALLPAGMLPDRVARPVKVQVNLLRDSDSAIPKSSLNSFRHHWKESGKVLSS